MNNKPVLCIFKKELKSYFSSPIAYIFITLFLIVTNYLFFMDYFLLEDANMRSYFSFLPWIFLLFIPAISMRLVAEEKRLNTIEVMLTLPISDWQFVFGKYLSALAFLVIAIFLSFPIVLVLYYTGSPDIGPVIGGYLGTVFMGAAYLSIGLFISSITRNQIIAFIVSAIIILLFLIIGLPMVLFSIPSWLIPVFKWLSFYDHFISISRGVIDMRDIAYYISVIFIFLILTYNSLKNRT